MTSGERKLRLVASPRERDGNKQVEWRVANEVATRFAKTETRPAMSLDA